MRLAVGEPDGMPAAIAAELCAIGRRIETERTTEIYAALHAGLPAARVTVSRDLAYGPHERQRLDVFTTAAEGIQRPVLVFVHGGGFVRGQKSAPGSPFFDNIMVWATTNGLVGVNINYRLAPEHQWPSGIEDLCRVRTWIDANIGAYGGDPGVVFFWGHSAGAAHVGDYVADGCRRVDTQQLAGAVLTSGFFELDREVSAWQAYYGDDTTLYQARSALRNLIATKTPIFVNDAELDPATFGPQSRKLAAGRREAGTPVQYVHLRGHSHLSETYAIGTSDRSLSDPVLEFIRANQ